MLSAPALLALQTGCPGDPPVFPGPPVDAGIECSEDVPCPSGQVCLSGQCFASCTATSCGPNETCGATGACIPRPPVDAGPPDAYLAPDASLACSLDCESISPTEPVCRFNACVECQIAVDCVGALGPLCDLGGGVCTEQDRSVCAPCDTDENCPAGGVCLTRAVSGVDYERVCVLPCDAAGACTAGFACQAGNCVPSGGATCTSYRAAREVPVSCLDVSDCVPLGAEILGVTGTARCEEGTCVIGCTGASQCPAALGLTTCTDGICVPG